MSSYRRTLRRIATASAFWVVAGIPLFFGMQQDTHAGFDIGPFYVDTDVSHWNPTHFVPHAVDQLFFSDTEKHLEDIANDALAKSDLLLTKHEQLADELLGRQQHILAGYLHEATSTLNATIKSDIDDLREETEYQRRSLVLSTTVFGWNVVASIGAVLLVLALCGVLYCLTAYGRRAAQTNRAATLAGVTILGCLALVGMRSYHVWSYETDLQSRYTGDLTSLSLDALVEHATYLDAVEGTDSSTQRVKLAHVMRDVLTKPWSYSPEYDGAKSLSSLRDLERAYSRLCQQKDNPYAFALDSFVEYQVSNDRVGEYRSAVAAARALQSASAGSPSIGECWPNLAHSDDFTLAAVAAHYLDNYLSRPMTAEEFSANNVKPTTSLAQLLSARQSLLQNGTNALAGELKAFWAYGELVTTLLDKIGPAYAILAYSNAMASQTTGKAHNGYVAATFAAAARIVAAYDGIDQEHPGFIGALQAEEFESKGTPAVKSALGDPHVFYYRAWLLQQGQPKECLDGSKMNDSYETVRRQLLGVVGEPQLETITCSLRAVATVPDKTDFKQYKAANAALWGSLVTTRLLRQHIDGSISPAMYDFLEEDSFASLQRGAAELDAAEKAIATIVTSRVQIPQQPTARDGLVMALHDLSKIRVMTRLFICAGDQPQACGDEGAPLLSAITRGIIDSSVRAAVRDSLRRQSSVRDPLLL